MSLYYNAISLCCCIVSVILYENNNYSDISENFEPDAWEILEDNRQGVKSE